MDSFNQRKKDILFKEDKSSKGSWDSKILELCNKINLCENYYTTSSCSGRVIVLKDQKLKEKGMFFYVSHEEVDFEKFIGKINSKKEFVGDLKFKQVPPILHVACRDLESAKSLLKKGIGAGWKRSVILNLGRKIIVELNGTDKLEFPLIVGKKLIVDGNFLKIVIEKSNENLKKGWNKIKNLMETI